LKGFEEYCKDVKDAKFPDDDAHSYKITDEESARFIDMLKDM